MAILIVIIDSIIFVNFGNRYDKQLPKKVVTQDRRLKRSIDRTYLDLNVWTANNKATYSFIILSFSNIVLEATPQDSSLIKLIWHRMLKL